MSHVNNCLSDIDVVVKSRNGLAVAHQGTVHHDGRETEINSTFADLRTLSVILMHTDRNFRISFNCGLDKVFKESFSGILSGTCRSLHDNRSIDFAGGLHNCLNLLKIVDIECRNTVIIFSCVI